MRSRRTITPTIACLVALSAVIPAAAQASPLLSGYGGPGRGSQVILGSSLVNGGGAGGSKGEGESSSPGASSAGTGSAAGSETAAGSPARRHAATRSGGAGRHADGRTGRSSSSGARVNPTSPHLTLTREAGSSETLGFSGKDLFFLLLAVGALIGTGVLTRRMARTTATGGHGGS
jgi:hypothetical protein